MLWRNSGDGEVNKNEKGVLILVITLIVLFGIDLSASVKRDTVYAEKNRLIQSCESTLPRTQHCKLVAVIDGGKNEK